VRRVMRSYDQSPPIVQRKNPDGTLMREGPALPLQPSRSERRNVADLAEQLAARVVQRKVLLLAVVR
jgi:hypothetical protein